jgi:hypothetical protein
LKTKAKKKNEDKANLKLRQNPPQKKDKKWHLRTSLENKALLGALPLCCRDESRVL